MKTTPYTNAPRLPEGAEVSLAELIPGAGPLMLEIGSGRGAFAIAYATAHPEERFLALEIRRKHATQLGQKMAARELKNARCFAEDAREALPRLQPDGGVHAVAIHFPDPWWKKRHAKRLVVADELVTQLARVVAPDGLVFVQTDVETRADEYLARFEASPAFRNAAPEGERFVAESPFAPARSNREARAIEDVLPVYRIVMRRV